MSRTAAGSGWDETDGSAVNPSVHRYTLWDGLTCQQSTHPHTLWQGLTGPLATHLALVRQDTARAAHRPRQLRERPSQLTTHSAQCPAWDGQDSGRDWRRRFRGTQLADGYEQAARQLAIPRQPAPAAGSISPLSVVAASPARGGPHRTGRRPERSAGE